MSERTTAANFDSEEWLTNLRGEWERLAAELVQRPLVVAVYGAIGREDLLEAELDYADFEAYERCVCQDLENDVYWAIEGYSTWLAAIIVRQGTHLAGRVLMTPSDEQIEEICQQYGDLHPQLCAAVIWEMMTVGQHLPLLGTVIADRQLQPDLTALALFKQLLELEDSILQVDAAATTDTTRPGINRPS